MLKATMVTSENELLHIHQLNQRNLKQHLDEETQKVEGFVTWLYSIELLKKMHQLSPSIIVKDGKKVIAYALTAIEQSRTFHTDLENMFHNLETVKYQDQSLSSHRFYCMGQICVEKEFRGKGIVNMLYQKHKEVYSPKYDFILTEISTSNHRSLKAHENIGFESIYTYRDDVDEWCVVVWDWK